MNVSSGTRRLVLALTLTDERQVTRHRIFEVVPGYSEMKADTALRTLERDIQTLRQVGMAVEASQSEDDGQYYYRINNTDHADVKFSAAEQEILYSAASSWSWSADGPALLAKARILSNESGPATLDARLESAEQTPALLRAIENGQRVRFAYASRRATQTRTVVPWRLLVEGRSIYLWGLDIDREEPRLFRVARIVGAVDVAGPADSVREEVPFSRDEIFEVAPLLLVRQGTAPVVRFHCAEPSVPGGGEWEQLQGTRRSSSLWERLVLENVEDVVVLEPQGFRERILASLRGLTNGTR